MKNSRFERIAKGLKPLLKKGIRENVFSGAAAGIILKEKGGEKKLILIQGKTGKNRDSQEVNSTTLFDLASLTKPLCTTLGIACLVYRGDITWQSKTGDIFPCPSPFSELTLENLLSHSSGLAAYKPFFHEFKPVVKKGNVDIIIQKIVEEKLEYTPGTRRVYSDLGYIILGQVIEKVSGMSLDTFFNRHIAVPAEVEKHVFFRSPVRQNEGTNIMETGFCQWRNRNLRGEVHDEHCWLMNGVAGHAGLFGNIEGVLSLCEHIFDVLGKKRVFKGFDSDILDKMVRRKHRDKSWCLGFDTPSVNGSSAGSGFSDTSIGHLGFTGTSFWMDLKKGLIVVLLTNRVCMSNNSKKIRAFRPVFHDTITRALGFNRMD